MKFTFLPHLPVHLAFPNEIAEMHGGGGTRLA